MRFSKVKSLFFKILSKKFDKMKIRKFKEQISNALGYIQFDYDFEDPKQLIHIYNNQPKKLNKFNQLQKDQQKRIIAWSNEIHIMIRTMKGELLNI